MIYLTNVWSLNMLPESMEQCNCCFQKILPVDYDDLASILNDEGTGEVINAIGHTDIAALAQAILAPYGCTLPPAQRATVTITGDEDEFIYIVQYRGPRLPEGTTILPEGATLAFYLFTMR